MALHLHRRTLLQLLDSPSLIPHSSTVATCTCVLLPIRHNLQYRRRRFSAGVRRRQQQQQQQQPPWQQQQQNGPFTQWNVQQDNTPDTDTPPPPPLSPPQNYKYYEEAWEQPDYHSQQQIEQQNAVYYNNSYTMPESLPPLIDFDVHETGGSLASRLIAKYGGWAGFNATASVEQWHREQKEWKNDPWNFDKRNEDGEDGFWGYDDVVEPAWQFAGLADELGGVGLAQRLNARRGVQMREFSTARSSAEQSTMSLAEKLRARAEEKAQGTVVDETSAALPEPVPLPQPQNWAADEIDDKFSLSTMPDWKRQGVRERLRQMKEGQKDNDEQGVTQGTAKRLAKKLGVSPPTRLRATPDGDRFADLVPKRHPGRFVLLNEDQGRPLLGSDPTKTHLFRVIKGDDTSKPQGSQPDRRQLFRLMNNDPKDARPLKLSWTAQNYMEAKESGLLTERGEDLNDTWNVAFDARNRDEQAKPLIREVFRAGPGFSYSDGEMEKSAVLANQERMRGLKELSKQSHANEDMPAIKLTRSWNMLSATDAKRVMTDLSRLAAKKRWLEESIGELLHENNTTYNNANPDILEKIKLKSEQRASVIQEIRELQLLKARKNLEHYLIEMARTEERYNAAMQLPEEHPKKSDMLWKARYNLNAFEVLTGTTDPNRPWIPNSAALFEERKEKALIFIRSRTQLFRTRLEKTWDRPATDHSRVVEINNIEEELVELSIKADKWTSATAESVSELDPAYQFHETKWQATVDFHKNSIATLERLIERTETLPATEEEKAGLVAKSKERIAHHQEVLSQHYDRFTELYRKQHARGGPKQMRLTEGPGRSVAGIDGNAEDNPLATLPADTFKRGDDKLKSVNAMITPVEVTRPRRTMISREYQLIRPQPSLQTNKPKEEKKLIRPVQTDRDPVPEAGLGDSEYAEAKVERNMATNPFLWGLRSAPPPSDEQPTITEIGERKSTTPIRIGITSSGLKEIPTSPLARTDDIDIDYSRRQAASSSSGGGPDEKYWQGVLFPSSVEEAKSSSSPEDAAFNPFVEADRPSPWFQQDSKHARSPIDGIGYRPPNNFNPFQEADSAQVRKTAPTVIRRSPIGPVLGERNRSSTWAINPQNIEGREEVEAAIRRSDIITGEDAEESNARTAKRILTYYFKLKDQGPTAEYKIQELLEREPWLKGQVADNGLYESRGGVARFVTDKAMENRVMNRKLGNTETPIKEVV